MDVVLKQVCNYVNQGWPQDKARIPEQCVTFYEKRVTGSRGRYFRSKVLLTLHEGHPGCWAMRALSRFYCWWPKIDVEVK